MENLELLIRVEKNGQSGRTEEQGEKGKQEVEMWSVWQDLPAELQTKVAEEHLPLPSLSRFRCVSRWWSKARLRPSALSGLHIHRSFTPDSCFYSLRSGKRRLRLLKRTSLALGYHTTPLGCINGLLGCAVSPSRPEPGTPVHFEVCNVLHRASWTELHPPPAHPRDALFAGMSKLPSVGCGDFPRIGADANLDDGFILVAGMVNYDEVLERSTNLLLQVYKGGVWSSSLFHFPDGYCLMYNESGVEKCGVLRGSIFYFLLMRLDLSSANLACIDLLSSDKRCKFLCKLDPGFVTRWEVVDDHHPKLAVCSGKLLLAYRRQVIGKEGVYTTSIQVLDEEKVTWRYVSSLPEELTGKKDFCPRGISDGGDELVILDNSSFISFSYNLLTGAWSSSCTSNVESPTADVLPMSILY